MCSLLYHISVLLYIRTFFLANINYLWCYYITCSYFYSKLFLCKKNIKPTKIKAAIVNFNKAKHNPIN